MVAIALLASVCAITFGTSLVRMNRAEDRLGVRVVVYTATRPIAPGETIDSAIIASVLVPQVGLAPSTLTVPPTSLVARQHIATGDLLNTTNVRITSSFHVPRGWRLVMVVPAVAMPNLAPGSVVDIVADAEVVAAGALVEEIIDEGRQVLVAVPADFAPLVATLTVTGEVSLVVN